MTQLTFNLHPAQLEVFTHKARFKTVAAGRRFGKALAVDTEIPTPTGIRLMGDVVVGDYVFTASGDATRVVATSGVMTERPCYRLTFSDGTEVVADEDHEWFMWDKAARKAAGRAENPIKTPRVVRTEDVAQALRVTSKEEAQWSVEVSGPLNYPTQALNIHPYVLGLWLGDGHSTAAYITVGRQDQTALGEKLVGLGISLERPRSQSLAHLVVSGKRGVFKRNLRSLNLVGNKHIPEIYLRGSIEQRLDLLRGLMDSGGTQNKSGNCEFSNTNVRLSAGFLELSQSLGIKARLRTGAATLYGRDCGPKYRVTFTTDLDVFALPRKLARNKSHPRPWQRMRYVLDCVQVPSVPVACIQVDDPSSSYLVTRACIRTHNSHLSAVSLLVEGMRAKNSYGYNLASKDVLYVAPTQQMARDILWKMLRALGKGAIDSVHENTMVARLVNGRNIHLKGSDNPDSLRGVGVGFIVLDEYAFMKPEVWDLILRPTLADVRGGALFIGTFDGKNHFYDLCQAAEGDPEWAHFNFKSAQNPFLAPEELDAMRKGMSHSAARQELDSCVDGGGASILDPGLLKTLSHDPEGLWYIAVDLAGFSDASKMARLSSKFRRLDEHAIACVKVGPEGWHIGEILHGRWDIREVSLRILRAAQKYRPFVVGIEGGSLKNAVMPYLTDQMRRLNIYPNIVEVTHGGRKKAERIAWALQGRLQNGRLSCSDGEYLRVLKDQMSDFPNPMAHDDLIDALAYIDQVAITGYGDQCSVDTFEPLDIITGY